MKNQSSQAIQNLINGARERAEEVVLDNEAHALDLVQIADYLENVLKMEGFKFEAKITNKPLVEVEPAFKHHPAVEGLLGNKAVATEIETKNLSKLKRYMFVKILKESNGILTYVKIKDSKATILHHKNEFNKGDGRQEYEVDKTYLIYQESFTSKRDSDGIWHFGKEFEYNKAMSLANKLGSFFAKAQEAKVRY